MIEIAVLNQAGRETEMTALADFLEIDVVEDPSSADFLIEYDAQNRLTIRSVTVGGQPVFVDIQPLRQSKGKDPLMRAIGHKTRSVFDATAGWATDAMHIAAHQIAVIACERNPIVYKLVADGLRRSGACGINEHLQLRYCDSLQALSTITDRPEVVYLDPMYPAKTGNAAPKKRLQILQSLYQMQRYKDMDTDISESDLLTTARRVAQHRVVVKRPRHAPWIGSKPVGEVNAKLVRFDIYAPIPSQ